MCAEQALSTREEILYLLKTKGSQPVNQLAEALGITEMAVRRHLNTLEKNQYVNTKLVRQAMGRPTHQYYLTEEADHFFPKKYVDVTLDFLQTIEELDGTEKVNQLFEKREERLFQQYQKQMEGRSFSEKVAYLAEVQNEKGYMVQWEQVTEDTYSFVEYNCPIADVAKSYHQACTCELSLFKRLLQTDDVERTECYAKGGQHCKYTLRK